MQYDHTQSGPLYLLLLIVGIGMLVGAWLSPEQTIQLILASSGGLMLVFAVSFRQLTVSDEHDGLLISFGPLPLFRRRILYANIQSVERSRTTFLEGWGIHLSPGGGWVWNLWGLDCVDVYFKNGRRLRIGTDDPEGLESFLKGRVA
jgi:hypothetical protein